MKSVVIPAGVTEIGKDAFYGSGLESIEIPQSVEKIGSEAFADCENLVSARVPAHLKATPNDQFCGCDALEEITES